MIHFACPACGKGLKCADQAAGGMGTCPACREKVRVPAPAPVVPAPGQPVIGLCPWCDKPLSAADKVADAWAQCTSCQVLFPKDQLKEAPRELTAGDKPQSWDEYLETVLARKGAEVAYRGTWPDPEPSGDDEEEGPSEPEWRDAVIAACPWCRRPLFDDDATEPDWFNCPACNVRFTSNQALPPGAAEVDEEEESYEDDLEGEDWDLGGDDEDEDEDEEDFWDEEGKHSGDVPENDEFCWCCDAPLPVAEDIDQDNVRGDCWRCGYPTCPECDACRCGRYLYHGVTGPWGE
jgi:hypothetical protein